MASQSRRKQKARPNSTRRPRTKGKQNEQELFTRAHAAWERGDTRDAFRLFRLGANAGDASAQLNVGYMYDEGIGVRSSRQKALDWYRRAYRRGSAAAANNIGLVLRDKGRYSDAVRWLERARRRGDADSGLSIAEIYLKLGDTARAVRYLNQVRSSKSVTEETYRRATSLLRKHSRRK
jgi:TPR repeat protein